MSQLIESDAPSAPKVFQITVDIHLDPTRRVSRTDFERATRRAGAAAVGYLEGREYTVAGTEVRGRYVYLILGTSEREGTYRDERDVEPEPPAPKGKPLVRLEG